MLVNALLLTMALAQDEPPAVTYDPKATKVAILPVLNTSGEKWKELRERQEKSAAEWLRDSFKKRGFIVIDAADVSKAIQSLDLDLSDEENITRANVLAVGKAAGADLAHLTVVTDTRQANGGGFFEGSNGAVTVKSWLVDVSSGKPIFSARSNTAHSSRASHKTSDRQVWAVPLALSDTFKEFFNGYPESK
jgi:hypothetical protein